MRLLPACLLWLLSPLALCAQVLYDPGVAMSRMQAEGQPLLLVFSGSDWCAPCIRFDREVLSDSAFLSFAEGRFLVLEADFPQRKKQDSKLRAACEQLAETYNPKGVFPHILLLHPDGRIAANIAYQNQSARAFMAELTPLLNRMESPKEYRRHTRIMGCAFELLVVDQTESSAQAHLDAAEAEMRRSEALLTEFDERSQTSRINQMAGIAPVRVDSEVYELIRRAVHLSQLTQGAFDITAGSLRKLYDFRKGVQALPDPAAIATAQKLTGSAQIQLRDSGRVYLPQVGMRIGFGAIGKGYAADRARHILQQRGVQAGVINASGDLCVWGQKPGGSPWMAGIADPQDSTKVLFSFPLHAQAIATSGDYEQFFESEGIRYSHTLDPRTGYPVTGIRSVSVTGPSAELCDALATAVFVMGREAGLYLIEQLPQTQALIIDEQGRVFHSKGLTIDEKE
ncbi:MAG: FAD:protein FMN transferase [Bacteroidetes bacterium]|nr:MAG: FAD:protein FMN transferase [Bacteroidota bacterium]